MFSTEFLLTSLVVVLMPGTGVIYTVTTGLFSGRQASMAAALGCTAGIVPHLCAYFVNSPKRALWLQRTFAAVFAALAAKLAASEFNLVS